MILTHIFIAIFIFLIGAAIGSFLGVLVFRLPYSLSFIKPASRCDSCNTPIKSYDNIPLISFIFLKGRCRVCGAKIDPLLPIIELTSAVILLIIYIKFGAGFTFLKVSFFLILLLLMSFTDIKTTVDDRFETGIILDRYLMVAIVYALYYQFSNHNIIIGLASFALGFLALYITSVLYKLIREKDGVGDGDMLLLGAIAMFTTYNALGFIIVVASLSGILYWYAFYLLKKRRIIFMPFAPFLTIGAIGYILVYM